MRLKSPLRLVPRERRKRTMYAALRPLKQGLTLLGARASERTLYQLELAFNYVKLGRWMRERGFEFPHRVRDRHSVFASVAERVRDEKVLYLEFGVWRGGTLRYWAEALRHPDSELHGFDSFEGLPEDFAPAGGYVKGHFSLGGEPPKLDDPRITLHKGWFHETLPGFELPEHDVLVINLDADLYSSTIYVLRELAPAFRPGTYLYFDDLPHLDHEVRAFDEFMGETGLRFRGVCADRALTTAFFECTGRL